MLIDQNLLFNVVDNIRFIGWERIVRWSSSIEILVKLILDYLTIY